MKNVRNLQAVEDEAPADGPQIAKRSITPLVAADWIAKNTRNRPVRQALVLKYAEDMRRGRWLLNGSTIVMSNKGTIIDGQHRLLAVIKSGVSMDTFVASGVDEEAFATIDSGTARKFSDVLSILGYPQSTALAAVTRGWWIYRRAGRLGISSKEQAPTIQELRAEVEGNADLFIEAIRAVKPVQRQFGGGTAPWSLAWITFGLLSEDDRDHFFMRLEDGQNLREGEAIYAFRRFLDEAQRRSRAMPPNMLLAMAIKAWNKFRGREPTALLVYRASEEMPVPI